MLPNALLVQPGLTCISLSRGGPWMKAGTRTPPSNTNPFLPRSRPLAAAQPDPLSELNTITVFSYAPTNKFLMLLDVTCKIIYNQEEILFFVYNSFPLSISCLISSFLKMNIYTFSITNQSVRSYPNSNHSECPWFLYQMVAHLTIRTHGVNQAFRFVEGIWLHRKSHQI